MAMINCPECGKQISTYAKHCPNCGCVICNEPTKLLFNFSNVDEKVFPLYIEVCDKTYEIDYENVVRPPQYNLINVQSILPVFDVFVYTEEASDGQ